MNKSILNISLSIAIPEQLKLITKIKVRAITKMYGFLSIFLISSAMIGCKNLEEPPITQNIIPFGYGDMENDILKRKEDLPKNIKKVTQYSSDTILNIIEYDKDGNEIFKLYKQYVGQFWNGKYITMITANEYDGNDLEETYYFHSNVGFAYINHNSGILKEEILISEIQDPISNNDNPFRLIDTITTYRSMVNHPMIDKLKKVNPSRSVSREKFLFKDIVVERYHSISKSSESNDSTIYFYRSDGKLISKETSDEGGKLVDQLFYTPSGNLKRYVSKDANGDESWVRKYVYDKNNRIKTEKVDGWIYQYTYRGDNISSKVAFNGDLCIEKNLYTYNDLGYPTSVTMMDCQGNQISKKVYQYKFEYYK